jgi:glycosyltransferase involved in cell wall biosynthesis
MSADPIVSVVTPVYNGSAHLEDCIRSVLRQTRTDWEYVVYDNASTDGSADIVERHASADPRIRVVRSKEFVDLWPNHNRALRAIHPASRYCKVLQADDLLFPECLERMIDVAERHASVGIVASYRLLEDDVLHGGLFRHDQELMPGPELIRRVLLAAEPPFPDLGWVMGSPSSILVRADLVRVRDRFYDETFWHADADAALRSMLSSDCGFVHQVLTFTRMPPGAMSPYSYRVDSFLAEQGPLLLRYGSVLSPHERRAKLREWLRSYAWLVGRKALRPYRAAFEEFRAFHSVKIKQALSRAECDREARAVLSLLGAMLDGVARLRRET